MQNVSLQALSSSQRCRIAVLAFADARYDARTLNVCHTLADQMEVVLWNLAAVENPRWQWHAVTIPSHGRMLWRWVWFVAALIHRAWKHQATVIWAADVYCLLPAVVLGWRWKAAVIYDSRELYSSLSSLAHRPIAQRILAWYERVLVRHVARVVASGERDADELVGLLNLPLRPLVVLNVPFYQEPPKSNLLHQRCGIPSQQPILLYQGAVQKGRGLLQVIDAISLIPALHCCILGRGEFSPVIAEYAARRGVLDRVHLLGAVPYNELLKWTAAADIGWCWIEPISHSYELALPNKLFEYAMARIPVLASDLPAVREILEQFPFGVLVSPAATAEELAQAIQHLLADRESYAQWADRAAREFCYERQQSRIRQMFAQMCRQQ